MGEASRDLGVSKPTISRHLKMLEEAGVVTRVIDGRTHRLALRPDALAGAADWLESQRSRWEMRAERRAGASVRATISGIERMR